MKRGAEEQLVKDHTHDDDINEDESPGQGFKKADETVLATRPMRGLPKRVTASTPTPANPIASAPPITTPKFGGFGGFGLAGSSGSFSLTPPPANSLSTSSDSQASNLVPSYSSLSTPFAPTPPVSATASNAVKTFASFLGTPASSTQPSDAAGKQTELPEVPLSSSNQNEMADDVAELNYYTSIRGLNTSLLAAVSKTIEDDPFFDIGDLLERYKNLRTTLKRTFEEKSDDTISSSPPSVSAVSPVKPLGMPAPPSTFNGFGSSKTVSSFPTSNAASPSLFSSTPSSSPFSFATPPSGSGSLFGSKTQKEPSTTSSRPTGLPSSTTPSAFGTSSASSTLPFSLPAASSSKPKSSSTQNIFGSGAPSTTPTLFGNADKASANIFGNSTSTSTTTNTGGAFGGFGGLKPASGNIGNPVGYGFGTSPKTSDADRGQATVSNTTSVFSPPIFAEKKPDSDGDNSTEGGQSHGDETTESKPQTPEVNNNSELLAGNNQHDEEGEGEEDEDTMHSVKLKAYRMRKPDEKGGAGWVELGYGVLRLKKHKITGARRVLLRNSSSGKININFNIYSGLKPSQSKKALTFVGHSEGASQTYSVRLQTEGQATELKDAFDREIAHAKATDS